MICKRQCIRLIDFIIFAYLTDVKDSTGWSIYVFNDLCDAVVTFLGGNESSEAKRGSMRAKYSRFICICILYFVFVFVFCILFLPPPEKRCRQGEGLPRWIVHVCHHQCSSDGLVVLVYERSSNMLCILCVWVGCVR